MSLVRISVTSVGSGGGGTFFYPYTLQYSFQIVFHKNTSEKVFSTIIRIKHSVVWADCGVCRDPLSYGSNNKTWCCSGHMKDDPYKPHNRPKQHCFILI